METFMKKILSRRLLFILSLIATLFFGFVFFELQILPLKYYIPLMVILVIIVLALYFGEKDKHDQHPIRVTLLKLVNILLAVALIFGGLSGMKGSSLLAAITGGGDQTIEMDVIVLKNSAYQSIKDLKSQKFGGNTAMDAVNVNKCETSIEDEIGDIDVTPFATYAKAIEALEDKSIAAMIIKAVDLESLDEIEKGFNEKIKTIHRVDIKIPSVSANSAKVTKEPFHILISGTDKEGPIGTFALSDVNMIATINPVTKQVLLTSIPRDYFVDIIGMDGVSGKDKLTHSAKGGMDCTLKTIENFMGIQFNYYAKFNFTSFMNVVDALGGIDVTVPKYRVIGRDDGVFVTKKGKYTIKPGLNHFNAKQALSFVRERKAFVEGDTIRGKNQMLMLKAILKKCTSSAIITKMDGVFESLSSSFETNMSSSEIKSLINMQIDDMAPWDVQSYHLDGDPSQRSKVLATIGDVTKVNPNGMYITVPDQLSIDQAKKYIDSVMKGEILKVKD
ncbi:LCP family protein [Candidatus Stoquefichus massiliensis]|uniref:LCP family protein n=1 Tax=Candidatus Stoquefichus massiliensis TaxID=1470350 RepID=UPI0004B750B7|nr:LCP family protein [Candidatus Stoquefichus massiliensis]